MSGTATVDRARTDPEYGKGRVVLPSWYAKHSLQTDAAEWLVEHTAAPRFRIPALPHTVVSALELAHHAPHAIDPTQLVSIVSEDPVLGAELLRRTNSAAYAPVERIRSIAHAVAYLGVRRTRDLIIEIGLRRSVFHVPEYADLAEQVRRHCVATAHACRVVAQYAAVETEYAFLAGLLHDIGHFVGMYAVARTHGKARPDLEALWPVLMAAHERVGGEAAQRWGLPPDLYAVITTHHQAAPPDATPPLVAAVRIAEFLAAARGYAPDPPNVPAITAERPSASSVTDALVALHIAPTEAPLLRDRVVAALDSIEED